MIDNEFKKLLDEYIAEHFTGDESTDKDDNSPPPRILGALACAVPPIAFSGILGGLIFNKREDDSQFEPVGETFSEMLMRLIKESGKKPSEIYNHAEVDRQIFSRIKQNRDYQPSKDTVISFAFALKLDLPTTKKLLETAGYALSTAVRRDVIISCFIEHKRFNLMELNETLFKYGKSVLLKRK